MSASAAILYAVVIGWNGAPAPDVPALRFADDDAAEYARLFRDAGARTTLLTALDADSRALHADARPDGAPTLAAVLAALDRADAEIARSGAPGELYLVYSGHGDVDHGEGFVQLDGARLTRRTLYDRVLAGRRAARVHVIVDACKSYYLVFGRGVGRRPHDAPFLDGNSTTSGVPGHPEIGFALSTSSDTDSHEWEEFQGGIFGHEVRSALRGSADADDDGAVSYAELGAFVRTANAAIPNPRYRPRFTVIPPAASPSGSATPVLRWPRAAAAEGARRVRVDVPALGRFSVEDEVGRRLADANLGAAATLHLPGREPLFLRASDAGREYVLDGGAVRPGQSDPIGTTGQTVQSAPAGATDSSADRGEILLSTLAAGRVQGTARGALHAAFRRLFEAPYDRRAVEEWIAAPDSRAIDSDLLPPDPRRPARIATLVLASTALAAGAACSFGALGLREAHADGPQIDRAATNTSITTLNGAAIGLYVAGGASAAAWAILSLWPRRSPVMPSTVKPSRVALVPGPGAVGLALSATWE